MKHVFYIHSYITYFTSEQVIKHENLQEKQCVFLYGRGFEPKQKCVKVTEYACPFTHHPVNTFAVERKFWITWKKLRSFDAFVKDIVGGDTFHLYTNQTGIDFIRLLIKNKRCSGFSILEEGLYSYYTLDYVNSMLCPPVGSPSWLFKVIHFLNFGRKIMYGKTYLDPSYRRAYGLSERAFPSFPRRKILPFPFNRVREHGLEEKSILVFDSFLEYGVIGGGVFEKALERAFLFLTRKGVKELYVKYHPEQYTSFHFLEYARSIVGKYRVGTTVHELGKGECLELIASDNNLHRVTFYVFLSSIGIYASMCGRTAISFAKFIADEDPEYKCRLEDVPLVFKELVQAIE